jgi:hypothetical protein
MMPPSTASRGSMARRRGAGPSTTRARSAGSNRDAWHAQKSVFDCWCHIETGHPSCVHTAEYATTPAADWTRVSSLSSDGSRRIRATWLSGEPSRTTLVRGSIGYAICWGPPSGKSRGLMICPARSPYATTSTSPFRGRAMLGSSAAEALTRRADQQNPTPRATFRIVLRSWVTVSKPGPSDVGVQRARCYAVASRRPPVGES